MNCKMFFFSGGEKVNCKNVSLEASIRTAKCLLWWRAGELQNDFSGGE